MLELGFWIVDDGVTHPAPVLLIMQLRQMFHFKLKVLEHFLANLTLVHGLYLLVVGGGGQRR